MLAASTALLAAWQVSSPSLAQSAPGSPEIGRATAAAICSNCHLVEASQTKPFVDGVPSFEELAKDPAVTETRLRGFLARPHPAMPDPQLSRQEIDNIVSYILSRRAALR